MAKGHFPDCESGGSVGIKTLMHAGHQTVFGASRETREQVEDKLREAVEQALAQVKAATTPAERAAAAERLQAACSGLTNVVFCTSQLSEAIASFEAGPSKLSTK